MTAHTDMVHEVDVLTGKLVEALAQRGLLANTLIVVDQRQRRHPVRARAMATTRWADCTARKPTSGRADIACPSSSAGETARRGVRRSRRARCGTRSSAFTTSFLLSRNWPARASARTRRWTASAWRRFCWASEATIKPVRETLLIQSSPGRDALGEDRKASKKGRAASDSSSDNMAHALREGNWKLNIDMQDEPAALFDLSRDLAEKNNLIHEPAQRERVQRMTRIYREIRKSKRSTAPLTAR